MFTGNAHQQKTSSDKRKLEYVIERHEQLNRNYKLVSMLAHIALKRGFKMVIENPRSNPHYLNRFWVLQPTIIDLDRRLDGDYYKKPTQYWFIGFEPTYNIIFEPIEFVEKRVVEHMRGADRQRKRSEIHPQYANRFIRKYLIKE